MSSSRRTSYDRLGQDEFDEEVFTGLGKDATLLILCKVVRMFGFGFLAVMLVLYLIELKFTSTDIGLLFTLTLLGDAALSLLLTTHADVWGRKRTLLVGAAVGLVTTIVFITVSNFWVLVFAAIFGIITPSGNEIGPFMAVELSGLSQVSLDRSRTKLMAWYNLAGCLASATGAVVCGSTLYYCRNHTQLTGLMDYKVVLTMYATTQVILLILFANLTPAIEVDGGRAKVNDMSNPVKVFLGLHQSKWLVLKLSLLFMLDSFAGSFVLQSIISGWFSTTYHTSPQTLGLLVFICNIVAGFSALFAAQLADMIGLVLTMVVTHLPSNILLILVPLMPTQLWAIIMLCLRFSISQMDVPTRNAYVQGVVAPDERSAANGITNVVRSIGAATGPYLAGLLYDKPAYMNYPWFIAGGLKIVYDLLLLYNMRHVKPPEEQAKEINMTSKLATTSSNNYGTSKA